jgi:vancomycin resistance protein YoaR
VSTRTPEHDDTLVVAPTASQPETPAKRSRYGLITAIVAGSLLVIAGAIYLIGYLMAGDNVPKKAVVSGVAVGGLTPEAAVEKLSTELGPKAAEPIPVTANGKSAEVKPQNAGLEIDYEQSIAAAGGGRSLDPRHILNVLTGGSSTDAVVVVDQAKLSRATDNLAAKWGSKAADGKLRYSGATIKRTPARTGFALQRAEAATAIRDAFLIATAPVQLPAEITEPKITTQEVDKVIKEFAKPAVSAPIRVRAGTAGTFAVSPAMIGNSITFQPKDGGLAPKLDSKALLKNASSAIATLTFTKPKDATVRLVDGRPKVIPAINGMKVTAEELAKAVEPALTKTGADRTVSVKLIPAKAEFTTQDARNLGIKQVTGQFTTYFPYLPYRNINIGRAAELINGTLLKPGEIFSLNGIIGERTKANGFTEGYIIEDGKFRKELGGGVSQSATTTFNAMFFAGLKDIEHQPHSLFIDRYPAGREATVAWPGLDLKFQNDTRYGVLVQAWRVPGSAARKGSITVRMWSTKIYDKVVATKPVKSNITTGRDIEDDSKDCEPMEPVPGFDVDYQRLFYQNGTIVKRESFHWRYKPTDKVTCVPKEKS